jgi:hypothetical protein
MQSSWKQLYCMAGLCFRRCSSTDSRTFSTSMPLYAHSRTICVIPSTSWTTFRHPIAAALFHWPLVNRWHDLTQPVRSVTLLDAHADCWSFAELHCTQLISAEEEDAEHMNTTTNRIVVDKRQQYDIWEISTRIMINNDCVSSEQRITLNFRHSLIHSFMIILYNAHHNFLFFCLAFKAYSILQRRRMHQCLPSSLPACSVTAVYKERERTRGRGKG